MGNYFKDILSIYLCIVSSLLLKVDIPRFRNNSFIIIFKF